ncbi:MAG TPA: NAD-dependent epimerase/dehydratase family protein [Saprospiraceae bacterium]|nr:NAD-dependent epimerase/dehydratase family protein [Saprospiraceae bacterium]
MIEPRTALVLGATGLVGSRLVDLLLDDPVYTTVRVLSRRPLQRTHPNLHVEIVDFSDLPDDPDIFQADDLFIAFGTTMKKAGSREAFQWVDLDIPLAVALRALDAGTGNCLLVSSVGADPGSPVFYSRVKGELEQALEEAEFNSLQIFRPSFLMGERQENRPAERIGIALFRFFRWIKDDLLGIYSPMPIDMLARGMVNAAKMALEGKLIYHYREIRAISRQNIV